MSERERAGQLVMVDCPTSGVTDATRSAIIHSDVGAVILDGTSTAGRGTISGITAQLRGLAPRGVGLFIATDQEGGQVQRLQGPGFASIPSAVVQGQIDPAEAAIAGPHLGEPAATRRGEPQPRAGARHGAARLDRQPADRRPRPRVRPHAAGSDDPRPGGGRRYDGGGIDVTVKHFPGLGRVAGNTDVTGGVTDNVTTRNDPYLAPFRAAVRDHVPFVMMSTAIYTKIDPANPAAFSHTIVSGMLRGDLGFRGVVISDDLGVAAQVAQYSPGQRAVRFVAAGGDMRSPWTRRSPARWPTRSCRGRSRTRRSSGSWMPLCCGCCRPSRPRVALTQAINAA